MTNITFARALASFNSKARTLTQVDRAVIVRPQSGVTLDVWNAADALAAEGEVTFADMKAALPNVSPSTVAVQLSHWRKANTNLNVA